MGDTDPESGASSEGTSPRLSEVRAKAINEVFSPAIAVYERLKPIRDGEVDSVDAGFFYATIGEPHKTLLKGLKSIATELHLLPAEARDAIAQIASVVQCARNEIGFGDACLIYARQPLLKMAGEAGWKAVKNERPSPLEDLQGHILERSAEDTQNQTASDASVNEILAKAESNRQQQEDRELHQKQQRTSQQELLDAWNDVRSFTRDHVAQELGVTSSDAPSLHVEFCRRWGRKIVRLAQVLVRQGLDRHLKSVDPGDGTSDESLGTQYALEIMRTAIDGDEEKVSRMLANVSETKQTYEFMTSVSNMLRREILGLIRGAERSARTSGTIEGNETEGDETVTCVDAPTCDESPVKNTSVEKRDADADRPPSLKQTEPIDSATLRDELVQEESDDRIAIAKTATGSVHLFDRHENPVVNGNEKSTLTNAQYNVVLALLKAGNQGLTKDELDRRSGHGDARKILKRLSDSDSDWKSVISLAGSTGKGYRII